MLNVEVDVVEGHYGELSVLVDNERVVTAGPPGSLAFCRRAAGCGRRWSSSCVRSGRRTPVTPSRRVQWRALAASEGRR